jgi:hypothetical protein
MKAVYFKGANDVMNRPAGSTEEQCEDGIVHRGYDNEDNWPVFTLCFELNEQEREEFLKSGKIFIQVYGEGMSPVGMTVYNPVEQGWVRERTPRQPNHPMLVAAKKRHESLSSVEPNPETSVASKAK